MKKLVLIILTVLFAHNYSFSQLSFEVVEKKLPFSDKAMSYATNIIGYGQDIVLQKWQNYIDGLWVIIVLVLILI